MHALTLRLAVTVCVCLLHFHSRCNAQPTTMQSKELEVEIKARYELVYEEAIYIQMSVRNLKTQPISLIKLEMLPSYDGALRFEIYDSFGRRMIDQGRRSRPAPFVRNQDLVEIRADDQREGTIRGLPIKLDGPGKYLVRAFYRPNWRNPPEYVREFTLTVIASAPAVVDEKLIPDAGLGPRFTTAIQKIRTADGYWLFAKNSEAPRLGRLAQVSEQTTFTVSPRREIPSGSLGEIEVTYKMNQEERVLRVDYEASTPIPQDSPE